MKKILLAAGVLILFWFFASWVAVVAGNTSGGCVNALNAFAILF